MNRTRKFFGALWLLLLLIVSSEVNAALITSTAATWPTLPAAETDDVLTSDPTPGGRSIANTRQVRQTFQVASDFTPASIVLSAANYGNTAFTIKIFEVADIVAATWSAGVQVGSTITVSPFGSTTSGTSNIEIALSGAEQFVIPQRNTGSQGYGMELALVNTGDATAFVWQHNLDLSNLAPGRYYTETGAGMDLSWDMGLALVAVPEPSSLAMLAFGMISLWLFRRQR
jgi:hypothetical protein